MLYFACNVQKQETHSVGEHDAHQDGEKKRDAHHDDGFFWVAVVVCGDCVWRGRGGGMSK